MPPSGREPTLDETFRELEERIQQAIQRIGQLQREQERLHCRIAALEQERAQAAARINIMLDRMESLG